MRLNSLKRNSKKGLLINSLILLVVGLSIGYAVLTQTLTTRGTATVAKTTWNIAFANPVVTDESVSSIAPTISTDGATVSYTVDMTTPGQFYEFVVEVANNGTLDAKLSENPTLTDLTTEQSDYLNYTVTYDTDEGETIKKDDMLSVGQTRKIKIRLEYKLDVDASVLPQENTTVTLTFAMNYIQA